MFLKSFSAILLALPLFLSAPASAAPITVNFTNIDSYGLYGDPENYVRYVDVGAHSVITGVSYTLSLTAAPPSWLSDMVLSFEPTDFTAGAFFTPGFEFPEAGTASYAGSANLVDLGLSFQVGADGLLRMEFFENFDDVPGVDGIWHFADFIIEVEPGSSPVPEPASVLLLAAGLAAMRRGGMRRRPIVPTAPA